MSRFRVPVSSKASVSLTGSRGESGRGDEGHPRMQEGRYQTLPRWPFEAGPATATRWRREEGGEGTAPPG